VISPLQLPFVVSRLSSRTAALRWGQAPCTGPHLTHPSPSDSAGKTGQGLAPGAGGVVSRGRSSPPRGWDAKSLPPPRGTAPHHQTKPFRRDEEWIHKPPRGRNLSHYGLPSAALRSCFCKQVTAPLSQRNWRVAVATASSATHLKLSDVSTI